ncbi:MAG: phosphoadenosine phosphosulfate reductase family protein [Methanomicrobiales archaeon]|nr:phosphoadenosine phosphosulfate reductase family protein [Methanomicrobiales archaeon]
MIVLPLKKILYWCDRCNLPLIGKRCACGNDGRAVPLLKPYDVRPAMAHDLELLYQLLSGRFGIAPIPGVVLLNKTGGLDRTDLVIAHGKRMGWLTFDPVERVYRFDLEPDFLPHIAALATRGVLDLEETAEAPELLRRGRMGGKRFRVRTKEPDGVLILRFKKQWGTGVLRGEFVRVREMAPLNEEGARPDPDWEEVVERNKYHLKNLERNAIREIRRYMKTRPLANVSFSGGKDSLTALTLARRAGVGEAFFIDTGLELPETLEMAHREGVEIIPKSVDFWKMVEREGAPSKERRWCSTELKLKPLRRYLEGKGPVITIQGNRWYESWNRSSLGAISENPLVPMQLNMSPIRNWRALEVFLYLRWRRIDWNPLYNRGIERVGCYICPSMLESEYEELRRLHPELTERWDEFIRVTARETGYTEEYLRWGLWRWKSLPAKMKRLCESHGVCIPVRSDK